MKLPRSEAMDTRDVTLMVVSRLDRSRPEARLAGVGAMVSLRQGGMVI